MVDIDGLVAVYVALHSLPNAPQLDRSIAIATNILVEKSCELAKKFIEELNNNVSYWDVPLMNWISVMLSR